MPVGMSPFQSRRLLAVLSITGLEEGCRWYARRGESMSYRDRDRRGDYGESHRDNDDRDSYRSRDRDSYHRERDRDTRKRDAYPRGRDSYSRDRAPALAEVDVTRLYVGHLGRRTTDRDLEDIFTKYGRYESTLCVPDGTHKCFIVKEEGGGRHSPRSRNANRSKVLCQMREFRN